MNLGYINLFVLVCLIAVASSFIAYQITQLYYSLHPRRSSFLPSPITKIHLTLDEIIDEFGVDAGKYNFYEFGSGTATISAYLAKKHRFKTVNAIESDIQTYLMTCLFRKLQGHKINFIYGDIFKQKITKPAVIYVFLGSNMLKELVESGVLKDTIVISFIFKVPGKTAEKTYHIDQINKDIFVYKF